MSTPAEAALEAERRALLGDARSVDQLDGRQILRFVEVSQELRRLARAAGKVPERPGKRRPVALDIADL